jgi:hypothetical protein
MNSLHSAKRGEVAEIPHDHENRLVALCLGTYRSGGFGLTALGRVAADYSAVSGVSSEGPQRLEAWSGE